MIEKSYCPESCKICLKACPARALDGTTVDQKKCREHTFYPNARGFDIAWCHTCRSSCPNAAGIKKPKR